MPQTYQPADGGTFDFGEAYVFLGGRETKVHLGYLRLDYSSKYLVVALPTERQEALFECHLRGFAYLGGVPRRMRYDNLKPAVHKILTGKNRQEQAAWVSFRSHFLFESEYVTPGRGQEKGGVENLVGYVRRNFLVPLPDVQDFAELNAYLLDCCERDARQRQRFGRTVQELWQEERASLGRIAGEAAPGLCFSPGQGKPAPTSPVRWQLVFGAPGICWPPGNRPRLRLQGDHGLPGSGALPPMSAAMAGRKRFWTPITICRSYSRSPAPSPGPRRS